MALPRPFDVVVRRRVAHDCTVHFEGRAYSVPFALLEREVEIYGCSGEVEIRHEGDLVATHPRGTPELLVLNPAHFEGEPTDRGAAANSLGADGPAVGGNRRDGARETAP